VDGAWDTRRLMPAHTSIESDPSGFGRFQRGASGTTDGSLDFPPPQHWCRVSTEPAADGLNRSPIGHTRDGQDGRKFRIRFCETCSSSVYWDGDFRLTHYGIAVGAFADPTFPSLSVRANEVSVDRSPT
jgi:hypothetical protein